ncbi:MAG TPA: MFS transporter [Frankiaceae bacterium]|nr:MFS transporter [Frankiaceae bacterium]
MSSPLSILSPKNPTSRRDRRPPRAPGSPLVVLILILTCQLMIILDASVVITALPKIHESLHFSATGLSWVQNAYTLTFGGLLLLGARAGDILGRRRVFVAGIAVFTLASLMGGLAQSESWLLISRAVQGTAAAVAAPSTLALLMMTFTSARERARAVGFYSSISGAGSSVGLVLGGLLTSALSWRWGFFINVPVGVALVILAPRYLPETEPRPGRFDITGAITSTLGMTAIVYAFVRAASDGWADRGTIASFVAGAALLGGFVLTEMRAEQPITPLRLFADRSRAGSYLARLLILGGMFSFFFFITQYLQGVRDYSPLKTGVAFLPMTALMFTMVQVVPKLSRRFSNIQLMAGGVGLAVTGMTWLSRLGAQTQYFPQIALPMVLLGSGIGIALIPLTAASIEGVDQRDAGAASGLVNVAQQIGAAIGLAVMVTIFGAASRSGSHTSPQRNLAHSVASALTGSAVFLAVAFTVIVLLVRRRPNPPVALPESEQVLEYATSDAAA